MLDDVVEILALADLEAFAVVIVVVRNCSRVRTTFVDTDQPGFDIAFDGLD